MNKIITLIIFLTLVIPTVVKAQQIDQVSVGKNYKQQAYYNLKTGNVDFVANDAWDIAFSAFGQQDAGVFINESTTFMTQPQLAFLSSTTNWNEDIINTDLFVDSLAIYNPEKNWTEGAFNTIKEDENSPFDFGWGKYNPQTNTVKGNRIYVIKKRDGNFIKFQIESLIGGIYTIRYAELNGNNEYTHEIQKQDAINGMIHFSFDTNDLVNMPSDYDLIFQRYSTLLEAGGGVLIPYTVTGVLLSPTSSAVVIDGVDPADINVMNYVEELTSDPLTIGHEWKSYDFTSGWIIDENRTHLVKDIDGTLFQLTFLDFEGSGSGISTLKKTKVGTLSTTNNNDFSSYVNIYPNPTSEYISINNIENSQIYMLEIYDINARLIKRTNAKSNEKIYVGDMEKGTYYILVKNESSQTRSFPIIIR